MVIDYLHLKTPTFAVGAGNSFYIFESGGGSEHRVDCRKVRVNDGTYTSGNVFLAGGQTEAGVVLADYDVDASVSGFSDISATAVGNISRIDVLNYDKTTLDANATGDVTLDGEDTVDQVFTATFTGNRKVLMPNATTDDWLFSGRRFKIIRDAAVPGAFTLTVRNAADAVTFATITANNRGRVEMVFDRATNAWYLADFAEWT